MEDRAILQKQVLEVLCFLPQIELSGVAVLVPSDGLVLLEGSVGSDRDRGEILSVTRRVVGVEAVTDALLVRPTGRRSRFHESSGSDAIPRDRSGTRGPKRSVIDPRRGARASRAERPGSVGDRPG